MGSQRDQSENRKRKNDRSRWTKADQGKTTLQIYYAFYDLEDGEILIDGENIKDYRLKDLRGLMGIVTQREYFVQRHGLQQHRFWYA